MYSSGLFIFSKFVFLSEDHDVDLLQIHIKLYISCILPSFY